MHRLIYEMSILNINRFTRVEEPTASILHHKVVLQPFTDGVMSGYVTRHWEHYIKGQTQLEHDWTANLYGFSFFLSKTGFF